MNLDRVACCGLLPRWCIGCMFAEMFAGKTPFYCEEEKKSEQVDCTADVCRRFVVPFL